MSKLVSTRKRAEQTIHTINAFDKGSRVEGKGTKRLDARRKDYTDLMNTKTHGGQQQRKDTGGYHKPGSMK